jgi:predicted ATPase
MDGRGLIDRFAVKNFRSIQQCDVELAPLTFFIGPNGSGKTSFVDALLFVGAAMKTSLEQATAIRGGIHSILHHPISLPTTSRFEFHLSSSAGSVCEFLLELLINVNWSVSVSREVCRITNPEGEQSYYILEDGRVRGSAPVFPAVSADRIFLSNASGLPEFRPVFDFLAGLGLTEPTLPSVYEVSRRLGHMARAFDPTREETDLAGRFYRLKLRNPDRLEIIQQYLRAIAPPFDHLEVVESKNVRWLQFVDRSGSGLPRPFYISQSSAGLVNSAEMLLQLFDVSGEERLPSPVVIEEPEALLHPGAIQVIRDSFIEASKFRQILVTTHSPDLLDDPDVPAEWIRTVSRDDAGTHVETLDAGTKSIIRDRLYTAGQLLRQGGLVLKS